MARPRGGASASTTVTVGERVLVHLSGFLRHADDYACPPGMTQDGIATALGISRAHAALELKRLREAGRVEERMAHVADARARRKVYVLTPSGQDIARKMREHARARRLLLVRNGEDLEASGADAIDALRREGLREMEAVIRVLVADRIELVPTAPAPRPAARRPLLGRDVELAALREWLGPDPRPVAAIVGVAGIGKSAFLAAALEGVPRPAYLRRVRAHDDAHGLLCSFADFLARQGRRRLKAFLARAAYDPAEAVAVLREDLAGLLLAIDDLHASPAAEGLLASLADGASGWKLLVASRSIPTFYDRRDHVRGRVLEIHLQGLPEDAARALLEMRGSALEPEERERILRVARGHPLAIEILAANGLRSGGLETERFIGETVLDGIEDEAEGLLRTFAVLRRPAPSPELLGGTVAQLRRLVRMAVLQHTDEGYVLHDLVREFFLARATDAQRRAAQSLAAGYWEGRGDLLEAAHHRLESDDVDGALALLAQGGETLAESARAGELESCLLRIPEDRRPAGLLAETQMFLGKSAEARETLAGILRDGPPEARLSARINLGRIATRLGSYGEARALLAEAARDAEAAGDLRRQAEALRALGGAERRQGDLPVALENLARAAGLLDRWPREKARALTDLAAALISRDDLEEAKARLLEAAPLARRGSREDAAIQNNLAIVLSREGKPADAAKVFARSAELAIRSGEIRFASYALANAADNLLRLEDTAAAESAAERALALAGTIGDPVALSTARANLGLVYARRGEWQKAEASLLESVDLVRALQNPYSLASRYADLARMYEAQGRADDAAPWRARAEDLFARLRDGSSGGPRAI